MHVKRVAASSRLEDDLNTCKEDLELYALMLGHAVDGIVAHTLEGDLLFANPAAEEQWGYDAEEARRRGPWGWVSEDSRLTVATRVAEMLERGQLRFESHRTLADGRSMHQEIHSCPVETERGTVIISTTRDISERVAAEQLVRHLAYHDTLTGLANRVLLEDALAQAIVSAERHGDIVGVVFLDLDDFKPINDTFGHLVGDSVLREIARRLSSCVREGDTVARLGGDEFVLLLPRLVSPDALDAVVNKLAEEISRPIAVAGAEIRVTASIGAALRCPGEDAESLLMRADLHMYSGRRDRKADCEAF